MTSDKVTFGALLPTLEEAQKALFHEALRRAKGNVAEAARNVGVARSTFYRHIEASQ